ncbi:RecQ family ATP-dependent DNA helicase [Flavicella sediminum]|uniref:RecQ family ATP-dependent DNA helicase n=1 Tax=Flavicella sediminum TaxID=2585141 RepID=UPI00111E4595|nr:RecQ family ATP-dependent DNA helicase [Flavicella sediminum]
MKNPIDLLQKYWGHSAFRSPQEEIIRTVLNKQDCIALLPTGGGKSICFQIPALAQDGVCIVISPLLALMQDQVSNLEEKGIKAVALNKNRNQDDLIVLFDNIQFNDIKFLYLSPEKLQSPFIQDKIKQLQVNLVAIDEAHCISEWGHDFRPSYLELAILKELCPDANTIALTASATPKVIDDIAEFLDIQDSRIYKKSYKRENLAYQIFDVEDKFLRVHQILTKIKAPVIIYTNTRNETKKISDALNRDHFKSVYYHGGMTSKEKNKMFETWFSEEARIMVATNAFGMGIDKANIRCVIHLQLPQSVENYLQEAGRAGRDGHKAFSAILTNKHDVQQFKKRNQEQQLSIDFIKQVYFKLNQFFVIGVGELPLKSYEFNLSEFCHKYKFPLVNTYTTIKTLALENILDFQEGFQKKTILKFISSSAHVLEYSEQFPKRGKLIKTILRSHGGLFENFVSIDIYSLSKKISSTKVEVQQILEKLQTDGIVLYKPASTSASIQFLVPREDNRTINKVSKNIETRQLNKLKKAERFVEFIENNDTCRSVQLLTYFEESKLSNCGICDVCLAGKKEKPQIAIATKKQLLALLSQEELSSKEISLRIDSKESIILRTLQELLEENIIQLTKRNTYTLN